MSISGALHGALSGLRASSRMSEVIASNIANSLTPGYARRSVELSSQNNGVYGSVSITGTVRHTDPVILADRRAAGSEQAFHTTSNQFLSDLEGVIGTPDDPFSLSGRLSALNADFISASSRPDSIVRLNTAVNTAKELVQALNDASDKIQNSRSHADERISIEVEQLNSLLEQVEILNRKIVKAKSTGGNNLSLYDERQILIDDISKIVPVRLVEQKTGSIAVYSMNGTSLVDGSALHVDFDRSNSVTPYTSLAGGQLSGLSVNGREINTNFKSGPLGGGSLGAHFAVRDELGVDAQAELDAFARDLISRFENITQDASRTAGDPGLFTDSGEAMDAADEEGIASRIAVNHVVDPENGGVSSRLRDGLYVTELGPVGDSTLLTAYADNLSQKNPPASGSFSGVLFSSDGLLAALNSQVSADRLLSDQKLSFASSQHAEFKQQELALGVDTDSELQQLILIEKAYAANARMIQVVDEMLDTLLRI